MLPMEVADSLHSSAIISLCDLRQIDLQPQYTQLPADWSQ